MLATNISYPLFEANQVLSNEHLNQLFDFLNEQERLTRTNLIGIGIVCGLEPSIAADGTSIQISKGVGVTSEGYLITWGTQAALEWYRPYEVPDALPYREFGSGNNPFTPFPMWELMADRNNDPDAVRVSREFLQGVNQGPGEGDEKILVLFLECFAENNRNCTPNSCNDKGTTVINTIRPLLIRKQDIDLLQDRIRALGPEAEAYFSLADSMSNRLNLPTLKLSRFDVVATHLGSTTSIFEAFQLVMNQPVVEGVANAVSAAYQAFRPLLTDYPNNPFANLVANWAYLHDGSIETEGQYLWYQYYYDHLDTIIQAYEEFRLRGLEVLGLCCPDSRLFKRHLFLGNLGMEPIDGSYRHDFVPSPLFTRQLGALAELRLLFTRLVTLIQGLELPPNVNTIIGLPGGGFQLPGNVIRPNLGNFPFFRPNFIAAFRPRLATEVKITPSLLRSPLSKKAIPYHYRPVPLYQYWSYELTRQGKAHHNLGYRSGAWNTTDMFVRFPLSFDLEPHNFLRIEGHIGQNYTVVLNELLIQKERNRLPIDIVALKSGFNSDNIPLPNEVADCHFQDLDALYQAFREELICQICETVKRFYLTPILPNEQGQGPLVRAPQLPFLQQCSPNFRFRNNSIGAYYEDNLANHTDNGPYTIGLNSFYYIFQVLFIFRLVKLAEVIPNNLAELDISLFRDRYNNLLNLFEYFNNNILGITNDADPGNIPDNIDLEEFSDQLDQFIYICKLESFQKIYDEYQKRLEKVRNSLLFNQFVDQHPGIQHKAGVPLGGTFVMVYHGDEQPDEVISRDGTFVIRGRVVDGDNPVIGANIIQVGTNSGTVTNINGDFQLTVDRLPVTLEVVFTGVSNREFVVVSENVIAEIDLSAPPDTDNNLGRFTDIAVGTIIADFYLPYLCCSDCTPIQFILPKEPPTFSWEQVGCTTPNNTGQILIFPAGGTPPYDYSVDGGVNWNTLGEDPVDVNDGVQVQIRDAEGTLSVRRTVELLRPLVIDPIGQGECNEDGLSFTIQIFIAGGRPPYRVIANGETNEVPLGEEYGYAIFPSGQGGEVIVQDSSDPACEQQFTAEPIECEQPCNLPCNGKTRECGHPFWMQLNPNDQIVYQDVSLQVNAFSVISDETGQVFNFDDGALTELSNILSPNGDLSTAEDFTTFWDGQFIKANEFIQSILGEFFGSPNDPVIKLTYDPDGIDGFTTLRIEHYDCHRYRFEVMVKFNGVFDKHNYQRIWAYTEQDVKVQEESFLTNFDNFTSGGGLPAFDCILRDRCNSDVPDEALCKDPGSLEIGVDPGGEFNFVLFAQPSSENQIVFWMVEYALPALSNGTQISVIVPPLANPDNDPPIEVKEVVVRAIAVDRETTCATVATLTIPVGNG